MFTSFLNSHLFKKYLTAVFPDQRSTGHHLGFWEKSWHKINENCEILPKIIPHIPQNIEGIFVR
jgi:hypothetical protein